MSLVFPGSYATFHHQCNQMVDILIRLCNYNMHRLNLHDKPCVPKQEIKEEEQCVQRDNNNADAKAQTKNQEWLRARRHSFSACTNASKDAEGSKQNQNGHQIFDDNAEEDSDDNSIVSNDAEEEIKNTQKSRKGIKHDAEHMTKEEIDEVMQKCNESRPEGIECRSEGEKCIREECEDLEGHMLELASEIEMNKINEYHNVMLNSMHVNEMRYQKTEREKLAEKLNSEIKMNPKLDMKLQKSHNDCEKLEEFCNDFEEDNSDLEEDKEEMKVEIKRIMKLEDEHKKLLIKHDEAIKNRTSNNQVDKLKEELKLKVQETSKKNKKIQHLRELLKKNVQRTKHLEKLNKDSARKDRKRSSNM